MNSSLPTQIVAAFLVCNHSTFVSRRNTDASAYGGLLQNPGGKVEPGETPLAAVVREVREETGLDLPPERFRFLGNSREQTGEIGRYIVSAFSVDLKPDETPRHMEPTKHGPWMLASFDSLYRSPQDLLPALIETLKLAHCPIRRHEISNTA